MCCVPDHVCKGTTLRKRCQVFRHIFLFSQYYSLTLHSQRFATLPLETPYRGAVRLKGNGVRVPDCPAAVSRPYLRARTREPLKPCISVLSACALGYVLLPLRGVPFTTFDTPSTQSANNMAAWGGCVGMAGMPYPPMLWEGVRVWAASQKTCRNSFADGVIAVRLADWARMTATLTLYK
ncbi:putative uncharacterized protein [Leyella stercorea CAG:629]|uniref:Uncharacterized protein n=1 Tax=Leyella stercorea CAG:629 TaxID=1263103 RepID=R7H0P4_9BACT|nr:putative uncharacterized protein [Leyella stercorea CAG:629]